MTIGDEVAPDYILESGQVSGAGMGLEVDGVYQESQEEKGKNGYDPQNSPGS